MRFVIADDSRVTRMILQGSLQSAGHELVGIAENGQRAVDLCKEHRPDVVILDISMPEKSGDVAALEIHEGGYAGKIIMGTSMNQAGVVDKLKAIGCYLITKPFDGAIIAKRIEYIIQ